MLTAQAWNILDVYLHERRESLFEIFLAFMAWLDVNPNSDFPPISPLFGTFLALFQQVFIKNVSFFPSNLLKNMSEYLPNNLDTSELNPKVWQIFSPLFSLGEKKTRNFDEKQKKIQNFAKNQKRKSEKMTNGKFLLEFRRRKSTKTLTKIIQISAKKVPKSGEIGIRIHV